MKINSKLYEKIVSSLMFDEYDFDTTVVPNAKIIGSISGIPRQIDVLLDSKNGESNRRIIVDAKYHKRPIDIKKVEEFEGMMRDVSAQRGILVCPNGYTKAALRRAQELITIRLVTEDEVENIGFYGWENCSSQGCTGSLIWELNPTLITTDDPMTVTCSAKCDACSNFNVWCWGCGEKFSLDDEDEYQCECKDNTFWLTSIEDDEYNKSVYLHLICPVGFAANNPEKLLFGPITMNRRPIT
ncbi:restriction endonuclease [Acinetobacter ursingii]|uniref:Restriction endonuclease n=1 Tax=Acinetobacter ursingii TaxID=108980 RepID=A0AA46P317_9GAMM|nr:restriction endonuclease [Acinetobacter ursingii]UYF76549.1 restriction endonuclease [Acinetobacter ursingii]